MSSIFVDTIRKTGGTLGTDIRVKTTSVYESENSTGTTQNLVQGLAKAWCHFVGSDSSISYSDSFNMSGLTDNGAGSHAVSFSNNMGNAFYAGHVGGSTNRNGCIDTTTITTSGCTLETRTFENVATDAAYCMFSMKGDLA
tara:strand:+ start:75 stop:497 length:423 start_codon:yes stop_codon:yes gene_type:complete